VQLTIEKRINQARKRPGKTFRGGVKERKIFHITFLDALTGIVQKIGVRN
jgi:hypothetical protein